MDWPHSRCLSIESLLRSRISDLEQEVDRLREIGDQEREKGAARERELFDRTMAVTNPMAVHALRSSSPAPQSPALVRGAANDPRKRLRIPLPGQHQPRPSSTVREPILTPLQAGHRPSLMEELAKQKAAEGGQGQPTPDEEEAAANDAIGSATLTR